MNAKASTLPTLSTFDARRLLLHAQGLLDDPTRRATRSSILSLIKRMGFVQVDTINIVERAHHHILMSRFDNYRREFLWQMLEKDRSLFEHWTHDASVIPTSWYANWKPRFARYVKRIQSDGWWQNRLGPDPQALIDHVRERITNDGPLMSRDFQHENPGQGENTWWGWKPQKAALEYLWYTGETAVSRRINFHKVYDLASRVYPDVHGAPALDEPEHLDWACRAACARLGVATPAEIVAFWNAISTEDVKAWCQQAEASGELIRVLVESADGSTPRAALTLPDWKRRLRQAPAAPDRMRLLSPFDPVIRDRKRALRLFGFDYRFEAFVPEPKRKYGYYVLPLLEGERFVGRVDPKFHRDRGLLEIRRIWWEPKTPETKARRGALEAAVDRFSQQIGAETWKLPRRRRSTQA